MIDLAPLGDRAFLARFETEALARAWASGSAHPVPGVLEHVLAYRSVGVFLEPDADDVEGIGGRLRGVEPTAAEVSAGTLHRIPVLYDGDDLAEIAGRLGMSVDRLIALHASKDYDVMAVGFQPGFPYAGDLPPELQGLARRESPRPRVPAGSVAIAGRQTGIYPRNSPGGWHLLGRTPLQIADLRLGLFPIRSGDRLRFEPIGRDDFERLLGGLLREAR